MGTSASIYIIHIYLGAGLVKTMGTNASIYLGVG